MKARDVMTTTVVSVEPTMSVKDIAALMSEKRISGVPVVATDGRVVGIVSHSDLLHRHELETEPRRRWWLKVFIDPDSLAREYTKTHGVKAADVMTRPVVSVGPDTDLADVAEALDSRNIKRVPVLVDGRIVGLITRTDLVRALARAPASTPSARVDDATLQRVLVDKMKRQSWLNASFINLATSNGTVELSGFAASPDQRNALRVLIEETDGVKKLDDRLKVGFPPMSAV